MSVGSLAIAFLLLCSLHLSSSVIPAGFSTFFRGSSCPPGWIETPDSNGRIVVSVSQGSLSGLTVGTPLGNMEDRTHSHTISSSIYLDLKSVSGACVRGREKSLDEDVCSTEGNVNFFSQ